MRVSWGFACCFAVAMAMSPGDTAAEKPGAVEGIGAQEELGASLLPISGSLPMLPVTTTHAAASRVRGMELRGFLRDEDAQPDSVSCGHANRGALSDAAVLPLEGPGYVMAEPWRSRGTQYGTRELVGLIQRSAEAVSVQHDDSQLSVADLSIEGGGPIAFHRSHQSGRDVDLVYYAVDAEGNPFSPDSHMAYYNGKGRATYAQSPRFIKNIPERYFDLARNWSLVRAMLLDKEAVVDYIFVSPRIERWLIRYAKEIGEDEELIQLASKVLHAPRKVKGHNDHMHVRIACPEDDVAAGRCRNESAQSRRRARRWHRKVSCPRPVTVELPKS